LILVYKKYDSFDGQISFVLYQLSRVRFKKWRISGNAHNKCACAFILVRRGLLPESVLPAVMKGIYRELLPFTLVFYAKYDNLGR
jgi:hypothetical protein